MSRLQDIPLHAKILRLITIAIVGTLLVTGIAVVVYEQTTYQPRVERELASITELVAANLEAAISFSDKRAARENLAPLRASPSVELAAIYDAGGQLFAQYLAGAEEGPPDSVPVRDEGFWKTGGSLHSLHRIHDEAGPIGTVVLRYRLEPLAVRLPAHSPLLLAVFFALLVLGFVLTRSLDEHVTRRVLSLAGKARAVRDDHDTEFSETDESQDEIGQLFAAFREMHGALRKREREFRQLLESMNEGLVLLDTNENITFVNDAFLSMVGLGRDEVLGSPLADLLDGENLAKIRPALEAKNLDDETLDLRWETAPRSLITAVEIQDVHDKDGSLRGRLCMLTDITERRALAAQLQQSQKMEAIGRLAGGVAHDFNNLLCAINGFAEMAQIACEDGEDVSSFMAEILRAGNRAAALTSQLLAFSRKQVLTLEAVDLPQLTHELRDILERVIGETFTVVLRVDSQVRPVRADRTQVEQVLVNLAVNARDAMPKGGKLTIMVREGRECADFARKFPNANAEDYVCIIVSDTGSGMRQEMLDRIFDPFFTTKPRGKGTGLGLSTTYGIIQQHKGLIAVDSEVGQGTTFTVGLAITDEVPSIAPEPVVVPHSGQGETILVVEDSPTVRHYVINALKGIGYSPLEADGPRAAIAICEDHAAKIDLLLTDVVMPEMSGPQLCQQLSLLRSDMPVLYMSGYTDDALQEHGVMDPNVRLLPKPFTREELEAAVSGVLHCDDSSKPRVGT